jgi:pyroglutamyl-peptidase
MSGILLTGFEPFGGDALNSSWELVRRLDGERIAGLRVQAVQMPCVFARSGAALAEALRSKPALVLAVGQAASRGALSLERVAVNWIDARIPDNAGAQPVDEAVRSGAPPAYFSSLPIKAMAAASRAAGVPAEISFSAGSFVCNQLFFELQHQLRRRRSVRSGFLHVPSLGGALSLEAMATGLRAALAVAQGPESGGSAGQLD